MRAMFAAFLDFIGRLDPRDLATRFERSARRKSMGNWELYGEFYRSLCESPAGHVAAHLRRDIRAELRPGGARRRRGSAHSSDAA